MSSYRDVESRGDGVCVRACVCLECIKVHREREAVAVGKWQGNVVQSGVTDGENDLCSDVTSCLDARDATARLRLPSSVQRLPGVRGHALGPSRGRRRTLLQL